MKIAINCLGVNGGGGKTYFDHFLPALSQVDPETEYLVLVSPQTIGTLPASGPQMRYVPVPLSPGIVDRVLKEQAWLPRWLKKEKVNLLFSPADSTSLLASCPVVLAMRNMNLYVERDKGWSLPFRLKFFALSNFARFSAKIARKIIFVSHTSKQKITQKLNLSPGKERVIYHGVSPVFLQKANQIPPEISWINEKSPYLLSVSSIYRYKNYVRLILAFARCRKELPADYHLVIAGKPYDKPYYEEMKRTISAFKLESRVILADEVPYHCLPALYQHAKLFIFPSYLETFGHPLVEAMASEVPIVAAAIENSKEITEGAALYFSPDDVSDLCRALREALFQTELCSRLVEKGKERIKQFSWIRCARETATVFREALGDFPIHATSPREIAGYY